MLQIAIDGTSASGKGTLAKRLADYYHIEHIDTGAMYRSVALYVIEHKIAHDDIDAMVMYAEQLDIRFQKDGTIWIGNRDVSLAIRHDAVSMVASKVIATEPRIRQALVKRQQAIAQTRGVVMDGRDIGSVVLPDARFKFFVDASSEARAKRRFDEQNAKGFGNETYEEILTDIQIRDQQDYERKESPLIQVADAYLLNTSDITIDEMVEQAKEYIERRGE